MKFSKSLPAIRASHPVHTRLAIRDERNVSKLVRPIIAPIFLSFAVVDWLSAGFKNFFLFLTIRTVAVLLSLGLYYFLRGRVRYGVRFFFLFAPYMYAVQLIMFMNHSTLTPYFSGVGLILFSATIMFPLSLGISAWVYSLSMLPTVAMLMIQLFDTGDHNVLTALAMTFGSIMLSTANSVAARSEVHGRIFASEALARDLRNRKKEIAEKASELVRIRRLESQFSPEVVKAIISDSNLQNQMKKSEIVIIVFDVTDSTKKAATLAPDAYKEVIERIFDIIITSCAKWSITVDKFTGDGIQAFAGFPKVTTEDLYNATRAAIEVLQQVAAEEDMLHFKWQDKLGIKVGVCQGEALVGMLGAGSLKSFTAIGESVSFTHRLCSRAEPNSGLVYSFKSKDIDVVRLDDVQFSNVQITGLKGFDDKTFHALTVKPIFETFNVNATSPCSACGNKMELTEGPTGLPLMNCNFCEAQKLKKAA